MQEAERAFAAQQMIANGTIKDRAMSMTGASAGVMKYMASLNITSISEMTFAQRVRASTIALKEQALAWAATPMGMATIAVAGISLLVSGISWLNQKLEEHKQKLKEAAQESAKQAEESANATKSLLELKTQLNDGTKSTDELTSAFKEQLKAMGWTETEIDNLITKYGGLAGAIDEATRKALENARTTAHTDVATSSKSLEAEYDGSADIIGQDSTIEGLGRGMSGSGNAELDKQIREILNSKGFMYDPGNNWYRAKDDSAASIYEYYQGLQEIIQLMQQTASETNNSAILDSFLYNDVRDAVDQLSESANLYGDAISRLHNADAQLELADYLKTNSIDSKEAFDNYINGIKNSTEYSDEYKLVLIDVANNAFPQFSNAAKDAGKNVNKMTVSIGDLKSAADGLDTLGKAFKEMSDDGHISLDTLSEIKTTFAGSVDDIDSYIDRLMKAKAGSKEFTSALSELTYGYINQKLNTEQLANADETYIATLLKEVGVSNSAQVAQHMIAVAKEKLRLETQVLSAATASEINDLMNEEGATNATKQAIIELTREKVELNAQKIDSSDDIEELMGMAKAAGMAAESYAVLARLKESGITDVDMDTFVGPLSPAQQAALDDWNKLKAGEVDFKWDDITSYGYTPKTYYTNTDGKSGSDKNKPDYEDPTEAIINRINLRSKELEQQEESIQNQIELAELENDYKKQISLTNDLIDTRKKRIDELNTANAGLHNEAEWLRNSNPWDEDSWFDSQGNATEAYYKDFSSANKEQREIIKTLFDNLSKYKKAYTENTEEITELNKEILQSEKDIADARENNYNDLLDGVQRYADRVSDYYDDINEELDKQIQKEEGLLKIIEGQASATNSINDFKSEINKAYQDSLISEQYLNEDERNLLFNEDDYKNLSKMATETEGEISALSTQFYNDVIQAYEEGKPYLIESITAEYERQVDMKERELEIAKSQVELTKKQLELNNVLAEKNVKFLDQNGKWTWVADTDKVRQATEAMLDAQAEVDRKELEKKQQESINTYQRTIDGLKAQQSANDQRVKVMNDYIDDLSLAIEDCVDPIKTFEQLAVHLDGASSDVIAAFRKVVANITGGSSGGGTGSHDVGGHYGNPSGGDARSFASDMATMINNSNAWHSATSDSERNALHSENQAIADKHNLTFDSSSGKWKKPNGANAYASGTSYTKSGSALMGEEGFEAYISSNGRLIPINQPTIGNIPSGGIVFNTEQMSNLRNLWDLSNIGKAHINESLVNRSDLNRSVNDNSNHLNGDIIIQHVNNLEDFCTQLGNAFNRKNINLW